MAKFQIIKRISRLYLFLTLTLQIGMSQAESPNFVLIVADDLGWADLGVFGSEIRTPNIDALARNGLIMTDFRVAPTCSPTRSMLLTGVDNHLAGLGTMQGLQAPNQHDSKYYDGQLHDGVVTLAEVLADAGYSTLMAGKWHLGKSSDQYPHNRGFQQSFTLLQGGASHFADGLALHQDYIADYLENGRPVSLPEGFYSSISYTDKILDYIDAAGTDRPFFAYLAFTAPHDPLQVPDDWLDQYKGTYDAGPGAVRAARIAKQISLGLVPREAEPAEPVRFPAWTPMGKADWSERPLKQRLLDARPMEIYAAMVELMDLQVGRLVNELDQRGLLENTYIIFMSDNGAAATTPLIYPDTTREWLHRERNQGLEAMGRPGSHTYLGSEWAWVSNAPFRLFKATVAEGGIRVPFIVSGPEIGPGRHDSALGHAIDITPTLLSLAGVEVNDSRLYQGKLLPRGNSLHQLWQGDASGERDSGGALEERPMGFELFGNSAIVQGDWKATRILPPVGSGKWELFELLSDPGETADVAEKHQDKLDELIAQYRGYAADNRVIPPSPPPARSVSVLYAGKCNWWCEFRFDAIDSLFTVANFTRSVFESGETFQVVNDKQVVTRPKEETAMDKVSQMLLWFGFLWVLVGCVIGFVQGIRHTQHHARLGSLAQADDLLGYHKELQSYKQVTNAHTHSMLFPVILLLVAFAMPSMALSQMMARVLAGCLVASTVIWSVGGIFNLKPLKGIGDLLLVLSVMITLFSLYAAL